MKTTQTWKIGNCLDLLPEIQDKSIDLILSDLPYGNTKCVWDTQIALEKLWLEWLRISKDNSCIVLTSTMPYAIDLINSNRSMFRYDIIWEKNNCTGQMNAKKMPLRQHEYVLIFYKSLPTYNPQELIPCNIKKKSAKTEFLGQRPNSRPLGLEYTQEFKNYPKSIIHFDIERGLHPTQKPVALFEYLIKTYTNEGDTVHDSCLGSGTTLEACKNTNRNCIGFELSNEWEKYYPERIKSDFGMTNNQQEFLTSYNLAEI
ncbi:MAG: site-specific DNA-methyltransferase [Pedobacter sp.]|uniref:DNA-methyltransferase n=1 Tax=Pedobacter sp. TaxID=1411316 RepID=UPI003561A169